MSDSADPKGRRSRAVMSAAVLTAVLVVLAVPAWGVVRIDFDDLEGLRGPGDGPGRPITDQYADQGVSFNSPLALDYAQKMPAFPHTGTVAIEPCYARELCTRPLEMDFAQPQKRVQTWVGYNGQLPQTVIVHLLAFDADQNVLDRADARLGPSHAPVPIETSLEVAGPAARISSAEVRLEGFDAAETHTALAVDTIEFERGEPDLQLSPEKLDFDAVAVGEQTEEQLTVENVGDGDLTVERVEVGGEDHEAFEVASDRCTQQTLGPGGSCDVTVGFEPVEMGEASASLAIDSNATDTPHTVALTGSLTDSGLTDSGLTDSGDTPWWWVPWAAVGMVGAIVAAGLTRAARHRSPRWIREHLRVRPRWDVPVERTTEDLDRSEPHAVGLVPRADLGTQTFHEEVTE